MACFSDTTPFRAVQPSSLGFQPKSPAIIRVSPSIIVREKPPQIVAPHGLSHRERDVLTEGLDFLRRQGPGFWVSVEAGKAPEAEKTVRDLVSRVRSDIALYQGRGGMRKKHAVTVFEALGRDGSPKFNGHVVAIARDAAHRDKIIQALNGSKAYGKNILADPVTEWEKVTTYLLKEATQQARFRKGFRTIGGSIPLGLGGGNRVRLSDDLKEALIRSGRIEPFTRSYACRSPLPFVAAPPPPMTVEAWFASLPHLAAPPRRKRVPVKRAKHLPPSLPMDYPPTADEMMLRLGRTKQEIGERLGISRQQANNVIVRRFDTSKQVVRKVLEMALAA